MNKILIVGQTPPPFMGQAVMIETLLQGEYKTCQLFHVRMNFSKEVDEMGKFKLTKLIHLLKVVLEIFYFRVFCKTRVLYYPPANSDTFPVLRDLAILCSTRWMFRKTIFHFHSAGVSEIYSSQSAFVKLLFRWAYFNPDVAIRPSEFNTNDGAFFGAINQCVVPNGIADEFSPDLDARHQKRNTCTLLFVGLIRETKGILVLIDAMSLLVEKGLPVKAKIVGKFESTTFERVVRTKIDGYGISEFFDFTGVLTGQKKYRAYRDADIFCFPTFFETFGLVVAEAMQFELPVVVSRGQGVQSLVIDGTTGFLTDTKDSVAIATQVEKLVLNPELRLQMGQEGRKRYLKEFTIEKFRARMDDCFSLI